MSSRPLSAREQQDLHVQLAYFWHGRTPEERNEYADVLVFLMLEVDDPVAPAAFEIIVHEIIKSPSTPMPFTVECDEEMRAAVAVAVMDKLRAAGPGSETPADSADVAVDERAAAPADAPADLPAARPHVRPWRRLSDYQRDQPGSGRNFRGWLKAIAFRTAVDLMRRHPLLAQPGTDPHWRQTVPVEEWDDTDESMEQWYNETPLPVRLDVLRSLAVTAQWLREQDATDARVLCLRVDQGLGYGEIAEQVGLTPDAVRKRIARMRRKLRQHLGEPGDAGLEPDQPSGDAPA